MFTVAYNLCAYVFVQAYSSIAKCIAALSVACPQYGSAVVAQFIADIKVIALFLIYQTECDEMTTYG